MEEDEEIDEDQAFTKEDEEKYGEVMEEIAHNLRRSQKGKGRGGGLEEDEEEEEEYDDEDDEGG